MASSYGGYHGDDTYDYYSTPYDYNHGSSSEYGEPDQSFDYVSYNLYRNEYCATPSEVYVSTYCNEPDTMQYDPVRYHDYYPSQIHYSYINNYSTITNSLQYEPPSYDTVYFPSETKFTLSYSAVGFNEPEYDEYDSTPYSGGYDPVTTYGKPLPPSDKTCYPRSVPQSNGNINFSYGSVPSPYEKQNDPPSKNLNGSKPIDPKTDPDPSKNLSGSQTVVPKTDPDLAKNLNGIKPIDPENDSESSVGSGSEDEIGEDGLGGEIVEQSKVILNDDHPSEEGRYESYNKVLNQFSYGSGSESLDICDGIFGYWPCLAKREQQQRQMAKLNEVSYQEIRDDSWKSVADYLFGNPGVCDYENYYC